MSFLQNKVENKKYQQSSTDIMLSERIISRETTADFVNDILKYLIYEREQIPFPMETLKDFINKIGTDSKDKLKLNKNKMIYEQFVQIETVLSEMLLLMKSDQLSVNQICLVLGCSILLPKELFCIDISQICYQDVHNEDCKEMSHPLSFLSFYQKVQSNYDSLWHRFQIGTTKLNFLIKLQRDKINLFKQHSNGNQFTILNDFVLPKIGKHYYFTIKQQKCRCFNNNQTFEIYQDQSETVSIDDSLINSFNEIVLEDQQQIQDDFVWIQVQNSIKGFKL